MSYFNWPDIPFSGTEVDAFVVEYKALAEEIIEDYDYAAIPGATERRRHLKLPFRDKENLITFLEHGLLYAAFIVKQRAGNAGPGTDFNLENSPLPRPLPEGPTKRTIKDIGPSAEEEALKRCFEDHQEGKKNGSGGSGGSGGNGGSGAGPGTGGPGGNPPPGDDESDDPDDPNVPPNGDFGDKGEGDAMGSAGTTENLDECPDAIDAFDKAQALGTLDTSACIELALFSLFGATIGNVMQNIRWWYHWGLTQTFLVRYMNAIGGVYTKSDLTRISPFVGTWLREDIVTIMNNQNNPPLTPKPLTASQRAAYGMQPSHNLYQIDNTNHKLELAFGGFIVITDGTEVGGNLPAPPGKVVPQIASPNLTSHTQILQIRDDYDFDDYGLMIDRTLGGVAGDEFNDNQIKTGDEWEDPSTTPCEAAAKVSEQTPDGKWNSKIPGQWLRYLIARNAISYTEAGEYIRTTCKGKPFAIHLDFS